MRRYLIILLALFLLVLMAGCTDTTPIEDVKEEETTVVSPEDNYTEHEELTGYWESVNATLSTGVKSNVVLDFQEDQTFTLQLFYLDDYDQETSEIPDVTYRGVYIVDKDINQLTFDINVVIKDNETYTNDEVDVEVENIPVVSTYTYTVTEDTLNLVSENVNLNFIKDYDF